MAVLKLLVNIGLLIAMNLGLIVHGINVMQHEILPEKVIIPEHYNITIKTNIRNLIFDAEITTKIYIENDIKNIGLQISNMTIKDLSFIDYKNRDRHQIDAVIQRPDLGIIELHFRSVISPGFYFLIIRTNGFMYNNLDDSYNHNTRFKK